MNIGAWNIPKGHVESSDSSSFTAALREFTEETSLDLEIKSFEDFIDLGESMTKGGKVVKIFAVEKNFISDDEYKVEIQSNLCETEWPIDSGNMIEVPELESAYYFKINVAKRMIFPYQKVFLTRLEEKLQEKANAISNNEDIAEQIEGGAVEASATVADSGNASTPGMTTDSVFGTGHDCDKVVVPQKPKTDKDPGLTTSDINSLYVLTKTRKKDPLFKRVDLRRYQ